jgi:hypothetical protein
MTQRITNSSRPRRGGLLPVCGKNPPQATGARRRRSLAFALALSATVAAALIAARPAEAGSYVATQCSPADPGSGAVWERTSEDYRERRRCGSGDGLQVYQDASATIHGRYGAWVWRAPAGTIFTSLQANASLTNHAGHHGELWATRTNGSRVEFGAEHNDFRVHHAAGSYSRLEAMLRCAAANGCGRADNDTAHVYVKGVFIGVDDRSAPVVNIDGGSLLSAAVVRGIRTLSFDASDKGGGLRRVSAEVNGTEVAADVRNCALADGFATALSPCARVTDGTWSVNTARAEFVTGPNAVSACASDLALDSTANRDCERRTVWVDNVCPASTGPAGRISARFSGAGERALVRSDLSAALEGRVLGSSGEPASDETVCALTRVATERALVVIAETATTDDDGRYRLKLPPGASRDVFVHHVAGSTVVGRHGLTLRSRVRPTLRVHPPRQARNGDRLRFTGQLPGPACRERIVKIQAKVGEDRWQVFRTDRTNGSCRFRARYRLRTTSGPTTYRFRSLVPPQQRYPYERGHSKVKNVAVTG